MNKISQYIFSTVLGLVVFFFWIILHPYDLSFQEQNQLFLFTWDYFLERISVCGGLADYIAECITQFNYIPYLGEALMALLFVIFQIVTAASICRKEWYVLSFITPVMMLVYMNDIYVMLCYLIALIIAVSMCALYRRYPGLLWAVIATVLGYWLIGPAIFVFTLFAVLRERNWNSLIFDSRCIEMDLSSAVSLENPCFRSQLLQACSCGAAYAACDSSCGSACTCVLGSASKA